MYTFELQGDHSVMLTVLLLAVDGTNSLAMKASLRRNGKDKARGVPGTIVVMVWDTSERMRLMVLANGGNARPTYQNNTD